MTEKQKIFYRVLQLFMDERADEKIKRENYRKEFSRVKVMKLFFFFCLFDENNYFRDFFRNSFFAYPLGPVHEESYLYLKSEEGNKIFEDLCSGKVSEDEFLTGDEEDKQINMNFNNNKDYFKKLAKMPVDELVELSHMTDSWKNAYLYSSNDTPMNIEATLSNDKKIISDVLKHLAIA